MRVGRRRIFAKRFWIENFQISRCMFCQQSLPLASASEVGVANSSISICRDGVET